MHKQRMAAFCVAVALSCAGCMPVLAKTTGVDLGANITQDYFRDVSGGVRRGGGAPGTVNLDATIDGRAWGGSANDMFYVDLLGTTGSSISNRVGDLQGLDNIEAHNTAKVFSAWYQHRFADSGVSVRLGLQDYNALFNALDPAAIFLNSSFGLDPTIAQADVSTFPITSLGAVLRWQGASGIYVMGGIYNGTPGRNGHPDRTHLGYRSGDGVFSALETGVAGGGGRPWKVALGGWSRSTDYDDPAGRLRHRNHGVYAIGSKRLLGSDRQRPAVDAFFQLGNAPSGRNALDRYVGAGIDIIGLFPSRPEDVLGLGVARARTARVYRRATAASTRAETVLELTWAVAVNAHFSIQPDLQYIVDPGADTHIDNALALGVRMQLSW